MPDGRGHLRVWRRYRKAVFLIALAVTALGLFLYSLTNFSELVGLGIYFFLGYLLGYYIDPDLDQESTTSAKWRMMQHFKLLGAFMAGWFMPYGYMFKHRSTASHFPMLSTAIRLGWFLLFPLNFLILYFIIFSGHVISLFIFLFGLWLGLSFADALHAFADWGIIKVKR